VISLRTLPMSSELRQRDLCWLSRAWVEGLSRGGYELVAFEQNGQVQHVAAQDRRYAVKVVAEGDGTVGAQPARMVLVDVANSEDLKLDAGALSERSLFVVVRTPFDWKTPLLSHWGSRKDSQGESFSGLPVLLVARYSNLPMSFEQGLPDFLGLLSRLKLDGVSGLASPDIAAFRSPAPAAVPPAAQPPTAQPPTALPTEAPSAGPAQPAPPATEQPR
jgi:hypothetical protein